MTCRVAKLKKADFGSAFSENHKKLYAVFLNSFIFKLYTAPVK